MQIPQQQLWVKINITQLADPAHGPGTQHFDHRTEFFTGLGQPALDVLPVVAPHEQPGSAQLLESLRQQRRRRLRHAAPKIIEARAAGQQFSDDEHRPPLIE